MKSVTFNSHLELNMVKIKPEPWAAALPAQVQGVQGKQLGDAISPHCSLSSCHRVLHTCMGSSCAYLSNMTRSASLDKRTSPGVPSVRMNWIFSLCKQKKASKIPFANKASMCTTATSTEYIRNLWIMVFSTFFSLPRQVHVSSKILQPKSYFVLRKDAPIALTSSMFMCLCSRQAVSQRVKKKINPKNSHSSPCLLIQSRRLKSVKIHSYCRSEFTVFLNLCTNASHTLQCILVILKSVFSYHTARKISSSKKTCSTSPFYFI